MSPRKKDPDKPPLAPAPVVESRLLVLLQRAFEAEGCPGPDVLANAAGVGQATVYKWLRSRGTCQQFEAVERLVHALGWEFEVVKMGPHKLRRLGKSRPLLDDEAPPA